MLSLAQALAPQMHRWSLLGPLPYRLLEGLLGAGVQIPPSLATAFAHSLAGIDAAADPLGFCDLLDLGLNLGSGRSDDPCRRQLDRLVEMIERGIPEGPSIWHLSRKERREDALADSIETLVRAMAEAGPRRPEKQEATAVPPRALRCV
jgi:hypothetical protein